MTVCLSIQGRSVETRMSIYNLPECVLGTDVPYNYPHTFIVSRFLPSLLKCTHWPVPSLHMCSGTIKGIVFLFQFKPPTLRKLGGMQCILMLVCQKQPMLWELGSPRKLHLLPWTPFEQWIAGTSRMYLLSFVISHRPRCLFRRGGVAGLYGTVLPLLSSWAYSCYDDQHHEGVTYAYTHIHTNSIYHNTKNSRGHSEGSMHSSLWSTISWGQKQPGTHSVVQTNVVL